MSDERPERNQMVRVTMDPRDMRFKCYDCNDPLGVIESKEIWDKVTDYVGEEYGSKYIARAVHATEELSEFDPTGVTDAATGIPTILIRNFNALYGIVSESQNSTDIVDIEGVKEEHPALDYHEGENVMGIVVRCDEHR